MRTLQEVSVWARPLSVHPTPLVDQTEWWTTANSHRYTDDGRVVIAYGEGFTQVGHWTLGSGRSFRMRDEEVGQAPPGVRPQRLQDLGALLDFQARIQGHIELINQRFVRLLARVDKLFPTVRKEHEEISLYYPEVHPDGDGEEWRQVRVSWDTSGNEGRFAVSDGSVRDNDHDLGRLARLAHMDLARDLVRVSRRRSAWWLAWSGVRSLLLIGIAQRLPGGKMTWASYGVGGWPAPAIARVRVLDQVFVFFRERTDGQGFRPGRRDTHTDLPNGWILLGDFPADSNEFFDLDLNTSTKETTDGSQPDG